MKVKKNMNINNFTFIVTDACNFNCDYCYQLKEKKYISNTDIEKGVDFFYPYFQKEGRVYVNFFGGEPLLAYEQIKFGVQLIEDKNITGKKNIEFAITTNGSLLEDEKLAFFDKHHFFILLSFDGLAQEKSRQQGSLANMEKLIERIQSFPQIRFEINSVFSPRTIHQFFASMRYIIELQGSPVVTFNFNYMEDWPANTLEILKQELQGLTDYLLDYYHKTGRMPVLNFQSAIPQKPVPEETTGTKEAKKENIEQGERTETGQRIFRCKAGETRMAIAPESKVWGCFQFHDYLKNKTDDPQYTDFAFGSLDEFIAQYDSNYQGILASYAELRQDFFQVEEKFCFLCEYLDGCVICPVTAAYSSGSIGTISYRQCNLVKLQRQALSAFKKSVQG